MSYPPTLQPEPERSRRSTSGTGYVPDGYPTPPPPPASQGFEPQPYRQHRSSYSHSPGRTPNRRPSYGQEPYLPMPNPQVTHLAPSYPNPPERRQSENTHMRPPPRDEQFRRHSDHGRRSQSRHSTRSHDSRQSHKSHRSHRSDRSRRSDDDEDHHRRHRDEKHHHHHRPNRHHDDHHRRDSGHDDDDMKPIKRRNSHRVTMGDTLWEMFSVVKSALGPRDKY